MDERTHLAVQASLAWYEDVFGVHGIPNDVDDGLWRALGEPPRWHSAAKTLRPDIAADQVRRAVDRFEHCSVADSYGTLDLEGDGFDRLFTATWVFRPPRAQPARSWPSGWAVVGPQHLTAWNCAHDTTGVLVPALLHHPRFTLLAHHSRATVVAGAVLHLAGDAVELSNLWALGDPADEVAAALRCAEVLHPDRPVVGYSRGDELDLLTDAGCQPVGPHVVWVRR